MADLQKAIFNLEHRRFYVPNQEDADALDIAINSMKLLNSDMLRFALEYLHDADLSELGKENIKSLENIMDFLGMKYDAFEDFRKDIS